MLAKHRNELNLTHSEVFFFCYTISMTKTQNIVRWILLILVTIVLLGVGGMKLSGSPMEMTMFAGWGYPVWFMYFIGACEVLGAIGLHVKKVSRIAAICLIMLLCGAVGTHVFNAEGLVAPIPATVLILCLFGILYLDKKKA